VRKHFSLMERRIEESGGTIVKTIGDAVMAAFPTPAAALRAALALQRERPDPEVAALVHGLPQERFSADLKGVGELLLVRLTLSGSRAG
jgi:class 3 adenylate cyclase